MAKHTIGLDLLGGDTPPEAFAESLLACVNKLDQDVHVHVFCNPNLKDQLDGNPKLTLEIPSQQIAMDDDPLTAIKQKTGSSICQGIKRLHEGTLNAFVSLGNTGALLAAAQITLPLFEGIKRPALVALLPTKKGDVAVLDVGANVKCRALHLMQFAYMGIAYKRLFGTERPTVGLLNIGVEETKGRDELKVTYKGLAEELQDQFKGNIEGRDVFLGEADVIVTEGFSGNIFLKTAEGVSRFILGTLKEKVCEKKTYEALKSELDHHEYPGAVLCGLKGLVIKCHGDATPKNIVQALKQAVFLSKQGFTEKMNDALLHH